MASFRLPFVSSTVFLVAAVVLAMVIAVTVVWGLTVEQEAKLLASDGADDDLFGSSVALDGDTAIIGATGDDDERSCDCCNQAWAEIVGCPSCPPCEDTVCSLDPFCCSVSWDATCDGEAQAFCACCAGQVPGDCAVQDAGAAYVFVRTAGVWTEQAKLRPTDAMEENRFGWSVTLDGDTAVIGVTHHYDTSTGSAYVFTRNAGVWTEQARLLPADGVEGGRFGCSVALDGDTSVIGAYLGGDGRNTDGRGGGGDWLPCDCCNRASAGRVGCPSCPPCEDTVCSLDPFCCAVSWDAICDDEAQSFCTCCPEHIPGYCVYEPPSGAAHVFTRAGNVWTEEATLLASDGESGDVFGRSVALDGDTMVIGAPGDENGSGSAYVFVRTAGVWTEQARLLPTRSEVGGGEHFGQNVALDGDTAVIGTVASGSAYVFTRTGNVWTQQAKLVSPDAGGLDVALDGDTAMIGAPWNESNRDGSGLVYVFIRTGDVWTEKARLLPADGEGGIMFGFSLALDGDTAVIGAYADDDNGSYSGSAYVFRLIPVCGDGALDPGEECDDGNNDDGDGCASDCTVEEDVPATTGIGAILLTLALGGSAAHFMRRRATR